LLTFESTFTGGVTFTGGEATGSPTGLSIAGGSNYQFSGVNLSGNTTGIAISGSSSTIAIVGVNVNGSTTGINISGTASDINFIGNVGCVSGSTTCVTNTSSGANVATSPNVAPSYYLSSNWYLPFGPAQQTTGNATTANTIYCVYGYVSAQVTIKSLGAYLITGVSTDTAQLAIYSQSGGTLTLVDKTGNISAGTAQSASAINGSLSNTTDVLSPGVLYSLCENSGGALVFSAPNVSTAVNQQPMLLGSSSQAAINLPASGASAIVGRSISQTYTSGWPGTITESGMADVTTSLAPIISFQVN
jgi:hypothetical protein